MDVRRIELRASNAIASSAPYGAMGGAMSIGVR